MRWRMGLVSIMGAAQRKMIADSSIDAPCTAAVAQSQWHSRSGTAAVAQGGHRMTTMFKVGDHVGWNSEAGHVSGRIIKVHTRDFDYIASDGRGHRHHASPDKPQYEIRSDRTDHVAAHYGAALTRLDD